MQNNYIGSGSSVGVRLLSELKAVIVKKLKIVSYIFLEYYVFYLEPLSPANTAINHQQYRHNISRSSLLNFCINNPDVNDDLKIIFSIQTMKWESERQSLAEHFQQRAQSASSYMLSSRASRKLRQEVDEAAEEVERFKQEIQKRYLLSVSNKFYSFPYTQLAFDNPIEDTETRDLAGKGVYCLYNLSEQPIDSIELSRQKEAGENESKVRAVLQDIRGERSKLSQILQLINNRRKTRMQEYVSRSRQKKLAYKYGVIKQEDELLRKRLYTEPNQKLAGFIKKKEK